MRSEAAETSDGDRRVTAMGLARGRGGREGPGGAIRTRPGPASVVRGHRSGQRGFLVRGGRRAQADRASGSRKNPKHLLVYDQVLTGIPLSPDAGHKGADAELRQALQEIADSFNHDGEEDDDTG